MNKLILALVTAFAFVGITMTAQAGPAGGLPKLTSPQSAVEQVYCRRYKVCHGYGYNRRCHWVRRCD